MFGFTAKTEDHTNRVKEAAEKAAFRNFGHAAARISKDAKASIKTTRPRKNPKTGRKMRAKPSPPGSPPHTRGKPHENIRAAIRYSANKEGAVIGPMESFIGEAGVPHEFGESFEGARYPERAFMWPALEQNLHRFAGEWAGSIGG